MTTYCGSICFMASTQSGGKNTKYSFLSWFGPSKCHQRASLRSFSWRILCFFCRLCSIGSFLRRLIFEYTDVCASDLSSWVVKQISHDTIKTTSMFTFTVSTFFSVTTTAELYLILNSFATHIFHKGNCTFLPPRILNQWILQLTSHQAFPQFSVYLSFSARHNSYSLSYCNKCKLLLSNWVIGGCH